PARIDAPTPVGTAVPTPPPTPAVFAPVTGVPRSTASPSPTPARRPSRAAAPVLLGILLVAGELGLAGFLLRRRPRPRNGIASPPEGRYGVSSGTVLRGRLCVDAVLRRVELRHPRCAEALRVPGRASCNREAFADGGGGDRVLRRASHRSRAADANRGRARVGGGGGGLFHWPSALRLRAPF